MNILNAFTRKSLGYNTTRTLVTIIGIILSMALFTAVIEGAYSGQQFLVRSVEEAEGRWMVLESGLDLEQAERARHTDGVAESALWQEVGWGLIGSEPPEMMAQMGRISVMSMMFAPMMFPMVTGSSFTLK